jgi:hypothetical protein
MAASKAKNKSKRKRIRVKGGCRQDELRRIVRCLNRGDKYSKALWDVLCGLRGPDGGSESIKEATTGRIRGALGLDPYMLGAIVTVDQPGYRALRAALPASHFRAHAHAAFEALGLRW